MSFNYNPTNYSQTKSPNSSYKTFSQRYDKIQQKCEISRKFLDMSFSNAMNRDNSSSSYKYTLEFTSSPNFFGNSTGSMSPQKRYSSYHSDDYGLTPLSEYTSKLREIQSNLISNFETKDTAKSPLKPNPDLVQKYSKTYTNAPNKDDGVIELLDKEEQKLLDMILQNDSHHSNNSSSNDENSFDNIEKTINHKNDNKSDSIVNNNQHQAKESENDENDNKFQGALQGILDQSHQVATNINAFLKEFTINSNENISNIIEAHDHFSENDEFDKPSDFEAKFERKFRKNIHYDPITAKKENIETRISRDLANDKQLKKESIAKVIKKSSKPDIQRQITDLPELPESFSSDSDNHFIQFDDN